MGLWKKLREKGKKSESSADEEKRATSDAVLEAVDLRCVNQLYKYWLQEFLGVAPSSVHFDHTKFSLYDPQQLEATFGYQADVHIVYSAWRLPAYFDEVDQAWIAATGSGTIAAEHWHELTYPAKAVIAGPCGFDARGMSEPVQERMFKWKVGQLSKDRETPWAFALSEIDPGIEGPSSEYEWVLLNQPRPLSYRRRMRSFPDAASRSLSIEPLSPNRPPTTSYFRLRGIRLHGEERCVVVSFSLELTHKLLAREHGKWLAACEPQSRHV